MNRIDTLFQTKKKNILSVYFTAGYPQLNDTVPVIRALEAQGADLIEIGIPFSDPMADGPTIQHSGTVALRGGMSLKTLFAQLKDIRPDVRIPLILMGYLNPVLQYGIERFCRSCAEAGIDGVIIPDLPLADYLRDFKPVLEKHGLHGIQLITPETSGERVRQIDAATGGFIYVVSTAATTGAQEAFDEATLDYFRRTGEMGLRNPRLIGFGISNRAPFEAACRHAAGAIVGSAFVRLLGEHADPQTAAAKLMEKLK
jgi:tryptophan synthase alpha chain